MLATTQAQRIEAGGDDKEQHGIVKTLIIQKCRAQGR